MYTFSQQCTPDLCIKTHQSWPQTDSETPHFSVRGLHGARAAPAEPHSRPRGAAGQQRQHRGHVRDDGGPHRPREIERQKLFPPQLLMHSRSETEQRDHVGLRNGD